MLVFDLQTISVPTPVVKSQHALQLVHSVDSRVQNLCNNFDLLEGFPITDNIV